jgi:hypothetical protein
MWEEHAQIMQLCFQSCRAGTRINSADYGTKEDNKYE